MPIEAFGHIFKNKKAKRRHQKYIGLGIYQLDNLQAVKRLPVPTEVENIYTEFNSGKGHTLVVHTGTDFIDQEYNYNTARYHENHSITYPLLEEYYSETGEVLQLHFQGRVCWDRVYTYEHLERVGALKRYLKKQKIEEEKRIINRESLFYDSDESETSQGPGPVKVLNRVQRVSNSKFPYPCGKLNYTPTTDSVVCSGWVQRDIEYWWDKKQFHPREKGSKSILKKRKVPYYKVLPEPSIQREVEESLTSPWIVGQVTGFRRLDRERAEANNLTIVFEWVKLFAVPGFTHREVIDSVRPLGTEYYDVSNKSFNLWIDSRVKGSKNTSYLLQED